MKRLIRLSLLACLIYLQSCGGCLIKHKPGSDQSGTGSHSRILVPDATDNLIIKDDKDIVGYWVGTFYPYDTPEGAVNISIDEIADNNVTGHSMIAGAFYRFSGTMTRDENVYKFSVMQTAAGKYGGKFELSIAAGDSTLKCAWIPRGSTKKHESKWGFSKKLFRYNPNIKMMEYRFVDFAKSKKGEPYIEEDSTENDNTSYAMTTSDISTYNASTDLLTKDQVSNMKKADILILRNSIFARHGYAFKKERLRTYFEQQPWYIPISTDVTADLTSVEKKNIDLLIRYEKNAKEYYDTYGR